MLGANWLHDRGIDSLLTRRLAGALGGLAYLMAVVGLATGVAVAISAGLTLVMAALRVMRARGLRGVTGSGAVLDLDSVTFPLAGTMALAIGWGWLGDRWLALVPIAFMAWGDNAAGLVRAIRTGRAEGPFPSLAMLAVCLLAAALFQPYWVGAAGAVAASMVERFRPTQHPLWDDNVLTVGASLAAMTGVTWLFGG